MQLFHWRHLRLNFLFNKRGKRFPWEMKLRGDETVPMRVCFEHVSWLASRSVTHYLLALIATKLGTDAYGAVVMARTRWILREQCWESSSITVRHVGGGVTQSLESGPAFRLNPVAPHSFEMSDSVLSYSGMLSTARFWLCLPCGPEKGVWNIPE